MPTQQSAPRFQRLQWGVAMLAFVVMGAQTIRKGLRPHGFDLHAYLEAGAAALAGETPYVIEGVTFPYLYSPFFACLMVPWALVPNVVAVVAWYLISMWSIVYMLQQARTWLPPATGPSRWRGAALVVLAIGMFRLVHSNVLNGQVNLILIAMCVAFLAAERRGQHRRAGLWLAVAVHTKALPILLLVYLLLRKRWAAITWCALFGVTFTVLPVVFWSSETFSIYQSYLEQLSTKIANGTIDNGALTIASSGEVEYFTLRGAVATLIPAASPSVVVKYLCLVVVIGGAALLDWLLLRRRAPASHAAAFSIYLAAALMISPISEKHHLALMFPAWVLGAHRRDAPTQRCADGGGLARNRGQRVVGEALARRTVVLPLRVPGAVACLAQLFALADRRSGRRAVGGAGGYFTLRSSTVSLGCSSWIANSLTPRWPIEVVTSMRY